MKMMRYFLLIILFAFASGLAVGGNNNLKNYDYSNIDYWVNQHRNSNASVEEVTINILAKARNEQEKARAIFYWISTNIKYDYSYSNYYAKETFTNRTGVCNGFATLFHEMSGIANLESKLVSGYAKGASYKHGKPQPISNHAWNAIKLNGEWYHIECTWASCLRDFEYFFLTPPEQFVFSHLPLNESYNQTTNSWDYTLDINAQLLANPINFNKWDLLPDVTSKDMLAYPDYWNLSNFINGHPTSFTSGNYPTNYISTYNQGYGTEIHATTKGKTSNIEKYEVNEKPLLNEESIEFLQSFKQFIESPEFEALKEKVGIELESAYEYFKEYYCSGDMESDINTSLENLDTWWHSESVQTFKTQSKSALKSGLKYLLDAMDEE